MLRPHKSQVFFTRIHYIGLNKHKEIIMLNFIKKLFGKPAPVETEAPFGKPAFNPAYVAELEKPAKTVEFHEEIRAQVEAEKAKAPAKKPAAKKPAAKKAPAKIKAEPKKAPAKKAPKKSK